MRTYAYTGDKKRALIVGPYVVLFFVDINTNFVVELTRTLCERIYFGTN